MSMAASSEADRASFLLTACHRYAATSLKAATKAWMQRDHFSIGLIGMCDYLGKVFSSWD